VGTGFFQEQRVEVITAVIPAPFGFLEMERELAGHFNPMKKPKAETKGSM
jgi:hypothetical protein